MKTEGDVQPACRRSARLVGGLAIVLACALSNADLCQADSPTLMRWGAAPCDRGGPDLDEPLVTDRPDFTEASSTVGLGVAQLEIGYTYVFDNDGADQTVGHSYPEPLLRVGLLREWLELRVGWNYAT